MLFFCSQTYVSSSTDEEVRGPLVSLHMRSMAQIHASFFLQLEQPGTAESPRGDKPLMYEGMQIKTAPSHTLSVITDQNQKAEIALNNIALRLVHVMQPSTKAAGSRGLRGGRTSAQWTGQNLGRKMLCNERMSRMLSRNSLTKSRRLFVRKAAEAHRSTVFVLKRLITSGAAGRHLFFTV